MHFIGIDIGTSTICGVIYNLSTKQMEVITRNNNATIESSHSWENIQDCNVIMRLVLDIIDEFSAKYPDIKGIGFSGQMHGILYTDKGGNAVSPLYTWQDQRGNQLYKKDKTYTEYLSEKTGHQLATGFGLVTHFYNSKNNMVPAQALKICTIMDYAVMKLCGRTSPLTDYSNAASLGLFDISKLEFDTNSLQQVKIDTAILPDTNQSATLSGYYRDIPVYSAIGDNQASFLGSVQKINESIHITVGTSSQLTVYSDQYIHIPSLDTRPFPGGGYILVGAALSGGQSLAILRKFFEDTVKFFSENNEEIDYYAKMTSLDYDKSYKDIPVVETLFSGTRLDPDKRGSITQISTSNLDPENLIIGFIKGICHELYNYYNLIPEDLKRNKIILVGSGNGIKKNILLQKALEEEFNRKLNISTHQEESAFGACICAMTGGKYIGSFRNFYN